MYKEKTMESIKKRVASVLTDENKRKKLQYTCVFLFLGAVAAVMTVLNLITGKGVLSVVTAVFTVMCAVNFAMVRRGGKIGLKFAALSFMIEIIALLTFFVISGNPDGFSVIWAAMLPTFGMLLFGKKRASVLCAVMLLILVFFFWTPAGRSLLWYEYSGIFMMRYPILYTAFFMLSVILETIREITQRELDKLREKFKYESAHDYLTHLLNRQGLEELRERSEIKGEQVVFMIDIDLFKNVNDNYGHDIGDIVLAAVAKEIEETAGTDVCRWGGEEFVVWFPDSRKICDPNKIRKAIENLVIKIPNSDKTLSVTVSIGMAKGSGDFETLVQLADECMYRAKENGRNQVVRNDR